MKVLDWEAFEPEGCADSICIEMRSRKQRGEMEKVKVQRCNEDVMRRLYGCERIRLLIQSML